MKKNSVGAVISIIVTLGFIGIFYVLSFHEIPASNEKNFSTALIALISFVSAAFGFYLGSSYGSMMKNPDNSTSISNVEDVKK